MNDVIVKLLNKKWVSKNEIFKKKLKESSEEEENDQYYCLLSFKIKKFENWKNAIGKRSEGINSKVENRKRKKREIEESYKGGAWLYLRPIKALVWYKYLLQKNEHST